MSRMEQELIPSAPPMDRMEGDDTGNITHQDPPPSYEEVMAEDGLCCCRHWEAPPPYKLMPTAPPAESDDETSSNCSSCENLSNAYIDEHRPQLTKRQQRIKFGFKVASYTVGLPLKLIYEATRTRDFYHEDNDKGHLCSSLAKKADKVFSNRR